MRETESRQLLWITGSWQRKRGLWYFSWALDIFGLCAEQLIKYGKDPATPAAVIENGTTAKQKKAVSDLAHIEAAVREKGLSTPALIIIGEAVEMESRLDWFGRGALAGKRILITGTRHMVSELEAELKPLGAECVAVSLIESRPLWTKETAAALKNVAQYGWLVFTSRNRSRSVFPDDETDGAGSADSDACEVCSNWKRNGGGTFQAWIYL